MSKESKVRKKSVELEREQAAAARPSRIRRDPPPRPETALAKKLDQIDWRSPEWEKRVVVIGIMLFGLAFWLLTIGISEITSH